MSTPEPARPHYYVPSTAHPVVGGPGADLSHDETIAALGALDVAYAQSPAAPQGDTADVIERAAKIAHDRQCGCPDYQEHADEDTSFVEMMGAVSAAGLLAVSPAPESLNLEALAGVCHAYVSAWDDRHADATVLGSLARRVAVAASPAAPPVAGEVRKALALLVEAVTPEVNEKGAGGYLLARLTDARHVLASTSESAPAPADDAAAAGWLVAGYEHGRLVADWDGEVHVTREGGLTSLAHCREGYPDWDLYELRPATTEGAVLRRSEAESAVERVRSLLVGRRKTVRADDIHAALAALKEGQQHD